MKKLFCANLVPVIESDSISYKLDGEHEIPIGDDWDGDIEGYIRKRHLEIAPDKSRLDDCNKFYKKYPLTTPLDRNGIQTNDELFCEFDDGDLWSMTLYYVH